jgi:hypothetical protein
MGIDHPDRCIQPDQRGPRIIVKKVGTKDRNSALMSSRSHES